ncbi:MAG: pentapeptide repeat-containing protein [Cyanophyceae cyanobacterium]
MTNPGLALSSTFLRSGARLGRFPALASRLIAVGMTVAGTVLGASLISPAIAQDPQDVQTLLQTNACVQCNLRGAGLVYGNLQGADLRGADLRGANLSRANLRYADLRGANLEGATLFGSDLSAAQLQSARMGGSDLREAMLYGADMTGTDVRQAMLAGAMGVPTSIIGARDHYNWGVQEAGRQNYPGAVRYYSQAIAIDDTFAEAYLNRAVARAHLADYDGALADSAQAKALFEQKNDAEGAESADTFATELNKYLKAARRRERGGNGLGISIIEFVRGAGSFLIPLLL